MKRTIAMLVSLCLVFSVMGGVCVVSAADTFTLASGQAVDVVGGNLVQNASFESGVGNTYWADPNSEGGWTLWGMDGNNLTNAGGAVDGSRALHLQLKSNVSDSWATLKQTVGLAAGKSYVFSCYLKAPHNVEFGIGVAIVDDNSRLSSFSRNRDANGVAEFQHITATFAVPDEAVNPKAVISAGLGEKSTEKYIDLVEIYELADPSKVDIEEKEGAVFTGDVTIKVGSETTPLALEWVGDNVTPSGFYDDRDKYLDDIMFNIGRSFGGPVNPGKRNNVPVDVYDRASLEQAKNTVKADLKSNPILSADFMDQRMAELTALQPGYISYLEQMMNAERLGMRIMRVTSPWWQYMTLEEGQTEYTEDQWAYFYRMLWEDAWKQGFLEGYVFAKFFGQTDLNMGNEPDQNKNFNDWKLYAMEIVEVADGFRAGVEAAGYEPGRATLWGPTFAGWNTNAWDIIAQNADEAIDVYDYHTYGGGAGAHKTRIENFKNRIETYNSDGVIEPVSVSEFNWRLSGETYDWLDKMPGCISHVQIMRQQAISGLYASMRFSFGEMFFTDGTTSHTSRPERMVFAIRQFNRALQQGSEIVDYDLMDAASNQEFFVTKGENSYFVHLINNVVGDTETKLTVDFTEAGVQSGTAILREMSEEKNDEVVQTLPIENGKVTFDGLKGGAMYLVAAAHTDITPEKPEIHRAFGRISSTELWWSNKAEYSFFRVYKSTDGETFSLLADNVYNAYFEDTDVQEGQQYYYQIETVAYDKTSVRSDTVGPIILKPSGALPYQGDFENGTMDGFQTTGSFAVEEFQQLHGAVGAAKTGAMSTAVGGGSAWKDYTVNTLVRLREYDETQTQFGMFVRYQDENNYYKCMLDMAAREISITRVKDGVAAVLGKQPIPEAFKMIQDNKTYPLNVAVLGDEISFYAEMSGYDPPVGERSARVTVHDGELANGMAGLFVENAGRVYFEGLNAVEVFSDAFQGSAKADWTPISGDWSVGGVSNWWYRQNDASGDEWKMSLVTSGDIIDGYMAARVQTDGTAALIAKYQDENNFLRYEITDGKLSVIARVNGEETAYVKDLNFLEKSGAKSGEAVAITVTFARNLQRIAVNGHEVQRFFLYLPELSLGKFGVATRGSTAAFDQFLVSATTVDSNAPYFPDMVGHWAEASVKAMAEWNYLTGNPDGNFAPEADVTRAEFLAMVARLIGVDSNAPYQNAYSDVTADAWYAGTVQWAADRNLIPEAMVIGSEFKPEQAITREEMMALIVTAWQYAQPRVTLTEGDMSAFTDLNEASAWAVSFLQQAYGGGLITGRTETTIEPKGTATRAEAATMMERLYRKW